MLNQEQQISEQIKKAQNILIAFSKEGSGDGVASALALYLWLQKQGKKVEIAAEASEAYRAMDFLPNFSEIKDSLAHARQFVITLDIADAKVGHVKYKIEGNALNFIISPKEGMFNPEGVSARSNHFKYDLIITVNTPDTDLLGKIYENNTDLFYKVPIINIDHHPENEEYGQINYINLKAVATSEILFDLFQKISPEGITEELLNEDVTTCLLAGIIAKTKNFKTANVTPQTLSVAAHLIGLGARREEIVSRLYRSRGINVLKLWGRVLARLMNSLEGKLVWSVIPHMDFIKTDSSEKDLPGVIDELITNMPQAQVIALFYEAIIDGKLISKIMIHVVRNINALDLVKEYNPTGRKNLAQITVPKPCQEAEKEIVAFLENKMKQLPL